MHRPNPFLVAIVSGIFGALASLGVVSLQDKPDNASQKCLYAAVTAYPTLGEGKVLPECKRLSEGDRAIVYKQLEDFVNAYITK